MIEVIPGYPFPGELISRWRLATLVFMCRLCMASHLRILLRTACRYPRCLVGSTCSVQIHASCSFHRLLLDELPSWVRTLQNVKVHSTPAACRPMIGRDYRCTGCRTVRQARISRVGAASAGRPRDHGRCPPIRIHGCPPGGLKSKLEDILVNTESLEWKQQTRICMDVYAKFVVATTQITRSHRPINTDNFCSARPPHMSH